MSPPDKVPEYVYTTDIRPFVRYDAQVLPEEASLHDAIVALGRSQDHCVLLSKGTTRELAGILTSRDLAKLEKVPKSEFESKKAKDLATTSGVVGVKVDAKLWQLLRLINGENSKSRPFDRVPVVDESKNIVGLIDRHRLNEQMLQIESSQSAYVSVAPSGSVMSR